MLQEQEKMDSIIKKELKNKFSPEFLNRLDDIIVFDQLQPEDVIKIVDIELNKFINRMERQGYTFKVNKNAKEFLATEGYDQKYGARPIKRAIQKYVEDAVADAILDGILKEGKSYNISKAKEENKLLIK
jgi:ATP-dependent Clp protease ATP-binding subunit ClpC